MPTSSSPTRPPAQEILVAVVGSANLDIVIELPAAPQPGETVLGTGYSEHGGGKGENQAIAAARLAATAFIGAVGTDAAGEKLLRNMKSYGVEVEHVLRSDLPSGRAFITLTPDAENSIVVIPGASTSLSPEQVEAALDATGPAVVICQQEISAEAVTAAADWSTRNGRRFLLNASPVRPVADRVLSAADPLIVNADEARNILASRGEAAATPAKSNGAASLDADSRAAVDTGAAGDDPEHDLARDLLAISASVIVTAGSRGAYVASRDEPTVEHVAATPVRAVDTTGAGDEFAGTVAAALALGESLGAAAKRGSEASARLVALTRESR